MYTVILKSSDYNLAINSMGVDISNPSYQDYPNGCANKWHDHFATYREAVECVAKLEELIAAAPLCWKYSEFQISVHPKPPQIVEIADLSESELNQMLQQYDAENTAKWEAGEFNNAN